MKKILVDTPYENSWADSEFKRKHKKIVTHRYGWDGPVEEISYEKIEFKRSEAEENKMRSGVLIGGIILK